MKRFYGNRSLCRSVPRQRGFSLVEVMVALAIVSVGALGMAGLQTITIRNNNNALLESQAATLAQDLMERVRANPDGDYSTAFEGAMSAVTSCSGSNANCDTTAMAQYDLMAWRCSLGAVSSACAGSGIVNSQGDGLQARHSECAHRYDGERHHHLNQAESALPWNRTAQAPVSVESLHGQAPSALSPTDELPVRLMLMSRP